MLTKDCNQFTAALSLKRCQRSKKSPTHGLWRPTKFTFNHLKQLMDVIMFLDFILVLFFTRLLTY